MSILIPRLGFLVQATSQRQNLPGNYFLILTCKERPVASPFRISYNSLIQRMKSDLLLQYIHMYIPRHDSFFQMPILINFQWECRLISPILVILRPIKKIIHRSTVLCSVKPQYFCYVS